MISYSVEKLVEIVNGRVSSNAHLSYQFTGVSTDSRKIESDQLYIPLIGEVFNGHDFLPDVEKAGIKVALCDENVQYTPQSNEMTIVYVENTLDALHRIAAYYRDQVDPIVIAVTGSNGKTTTKDMISSVCGTSFVIHKTSGNLNNEFGLPYTLLSMPADTKVCIVELGMNHFGEISRLTKTAKPDIAVITNIGDAHIEFFGTRENIAKAKLEILEGLSPNGTFIHFGDEPLLSHSSQLFEGKVLTYGQEKSNDYFVTDVSWNGETGMTFNVNGKQSTFNIPLLGRYNAINALAAIAVGDLLNMKEEQIAEGLSTMRPSGMRLDIEKFESGLVILNDAYNASPTSMKATLDLLEELPTSRKKWALFGDILELGDSEEQLHREIGKYAVTKSVDKVFTVGQRAKWIHDEIVAVNNNMGGHFDSLDDYASWITTQQLSEVFLLLKASRGMSLERLLVLLDPERKESPNGH